MTDLDLISRAARVMDPVAWDLRAIPENLGQSWDQFDRRMTAEQHARRLAAAGMLREPECQEAS